VDPNLSTQVGPYAPWQVQPSGTAQPIVVNIELGDDIQQDILMQGSPQQNTASLQSSYSSPIPVPESGVWAGNLSPYGDVDYFSLSAPGRTIVIDVTTLDERGQPTELKLQPVIGAWSVADPPGTLAPAVSSSPFNVVTPGMTQLNAQFAAAGQFRIAIGDLRGDGRPDYSYHARVLYGDNAEPSRVSTRGNVPVEIDGIGFQAGTTVMIGNANATLLSLSSTDLLIWAPPAADGTQSISVSDPASGASVTLQDVRTYGAGPNDLIRLTQNGNSATPVGGETAYPIRVAVAGADGTTAVGGATVQWSANNNATLTACNGTSNCTVLTDDRGKVETRVDVGATGTATITATLAPASYSPPSWFRPSSVALRPHPICRCSRRGFGSQRALLWTCR
jgi:IPT/TIG domain